MNTDPGTGLNPEMKRVRLACAILITLGVLFLAVCTGSFDHEELPMSAKTVKYVRDETAHLVPRDDAKFRELIEADAAYNNRHRANVRLLIFLSILTAVWLPYLIVGLKKRNASKIKPV